LLGWLWEFLEREVQKHPLVGRIRESLHLNEVPREDVSCEQFSELGQGSRKTWGEDRTDRGFAQCRGACHQVAEGLTSVHSTNNPVRAVAIAERRGFVNRNGAIPAQAAKALKRFPQNLGLMPQLGGIRYVLIMTAAADSKVRAGRLNAVARRLKDVKRAAANPLSASLHGFDRKHFTG
jgi:hypothetical protein